MATSASPHIHTADFTVGASAVEIVSAASYARDVYVSTDDAVFLGGSNVTAATGLELNTTVVPLGPLRLLPNAVLYGIAASNRDVRVMQVEVGQ